MARSLRGFGAKFSLAFFGFIALALIVMSAVGSDALERGRTSLIDALTPALRALNVPMEVIDNAIVWTGNAIYVFRENERLTEENRRLREWQVTAQRLATENERLRALLNAHTSKALPVATARVIGQSAGSYVRAVMINAGTSSGVAHGNVAADATGVLGRVISTGRHTSRVLLLTDLNSRIPVKVLPADVNAILLGDNLDQPQLAFLPGDAKIAVGDWVVTTGHGGIFPPDLPVGQVAAVSAKSPPRVALSADMNRLDFIQILRFSAVGHAPAAHAPPAHDSAARDSGARDSAVHDPAARTPGVQSQPQSQKTPPANPPAAATPASPPTPAPQPQPQAQPQSQPEPASEPEPDSEPEPEPDSAPEPPVQSPAPGGTTP